MAKSTIISNLEELYKPLDNKWVSQNSLVINYAKGAGLSVGGSIAMAISNRKPHKIPGDFDFFTDDNEKSLKFIQNIIFWLSQRANTHYKIQFNTKTEFTLPGVSHHVRITVPFWKPICVMTLENPIRSFFYHGLKVQYFDDVVQAAKEATAKDGKKRITFDEEEAKKNIRARYCERGTYDINNDSTSPIRENSTPSRRLATRWAEELAQDIERVYDPLTGDLQGVATNNIVDWNQEYRAIPAISSRVDEDNFYSSIEAASNRINEARRNGPAIEFPTIDNTQLERCENDAPDTSLPTGTAYFPTINQDNNLYSRIVIPANRLNAARRGEDNLTS